MEQNSLVNNNFNTNLNEDQLFSYMKIYLPKTINNKLTDKDIKDSINYIQSISSDHDETQSIIDSFVDNIDIFSSSKYNVKSYIDAIIYITFLYRGYSIKDAYVRTFKSKIKQMLLDYGGDIDKRNDAIYHAAKYYHNKDLVNKIKEKVSQPAWLLHQNIFNIAVNTAEEIMLNGKSELARVQMTNSILSNFKKPEIQKVDVDVKDNRKVEDLIFAMENLSKKQKELTEKGIPITQQPTISVTDYEVINE